MDNNIKIEIILDTLELIKKSIINNVNNGEDYNLIKCPKYNPCYIKYGSGYKKLLGKIFKNLDHKKNFSGKYVKEFIDELVSEILENRIETVAKNPLIVDVFDDYFHEIIVYIPLEGIELEIDNLKIGNTILKKFDQSQKDFHLNKLDSMFTINPHVDNNEKKALMTHMNESLSEIVGKTCGEYRVFAEKDKGLELAEIECKKILDLLRYAISFLHHKNNNINVGFHGDLNSAIRYTLIAKSDFKTYHFIQKKIGPLFEFKISQEVSKELEKIGFNSISKIIKKPEVKLSDFEKTILLSLHWFSDSQTQSENDNEFLSLMVSIEIMLSPGKNENIVSVISEYTALILHKPNKYYNAIKEFKELYDKRSQIVHGSYNDVDKKELDKLRFITKNLLNWMVQNKIQFNSKDDMLSFLKEQNYKMKIFN